MSISQSQKSLSIPFFFLFSKQKNQQSDAGATNMRKKYDVNSMQKKNKKKSQAKDDVCRQFLDCDIISENSFDCLRKIHKMHFPIDKNRKLAHSPGSDNNTPLIKV